MILSKNNLPGLSGAPGVKFPDQKVFSLPEKVLQFGTGVFVRGLIDYYINKANHAGIFNGRAVLIKSTEAGDINSFNVQDNLFTQIMKSTNDGVEIEETIVNAAISRVINAKDWAQVLACAANPGIKIIISNTTEIGIILDETDSISFRPPVSFPAKLLSFLYARYHAFKGTGDSGMVIIPTELIPDNASKLKAILNVLAANENLPVGFIDWLNNSNDFCNSLVDRIVPGRLPLNEHLEKQKELGYEDELMIMSETFGLWAIETSNEQTKAILSFSKADSGIHIVPNIDKFRELKLRLLNGSHNLSCAVGFLAGFKTVKEAMANPVFDRLMQQLINTEIAAAIVSPAITIEDAREFGTEVLKRYRNPYIEFDWLSICVQDTSKIKIRAVPIVQQHFRKYGFVPDAICLGFAAYILFMHAKTEIDGDRYGISDGQKYKIIDDFAGLLSQKWHSYQGLDLVRSVLGDKALWDQDLSVFTDFAERVLFFMINMQVSGFYETVKLIDDQQYGT
ncbi:tagaturonate reductase [Mucilaginibacter sp. X5P1]|uniref:tagaturonate reductase n=1 Tax=Mucilaginibacter sp. X5P1 TaxID=2723088 RepID=UPI0016153493|nr:tagaturonate reductase [Mucilaginibacter sp. X5P1]MBB6140882.1 tagaturonate reductase [Mucilaginibacter sp. X5P1]